MTRLNPDSTISLALAHSVDISENEKIYTFTLREAYWENGDKITAYDFEKSWKSLLSPTFPSLNAHLFYPIENAQAIKMGTLPSETLGVVSLDEKTLQVTLEYPTPYFLELTAFCSFYPYKSGQNLCLSNGPFRIKSWQPHRKLLLEKNPQYWNHKHVDLDIIDMLMIADETTALHLFEKGELDIIGAPSSHLSKDALIHFSDQIQAHPSIATMHCMFNTKKYPFNNQNLRKAFGLSVNRSEIVKHLSHQAQTPALELVSPFLNPCPQQPLFTDHSLEIARAYFESALKELNIDNPSNLKLTYLYTSSDFNKEIALILQHQWHQALGIWVKLKQVDSKIMIDRLTRGDFQFSQSTIYPQYNDPMSVLERLKYADVHKNYTQWEKKEYIDCLNSSYFIKNKEQRFLQLNQAEKIVLDEMPLCPLFHLTYAYIAKPHLKNLFFTPVGGIYFSTLQISLDDQKENIK